MRHVIYLLVVANLVFLGWHMLQLQKQEGTVRALPPIPATASSLVTLQEMEEEQETVSEFKPEPGSGLDPELQDLEQQDPNLQDPELTGLDEQLDLVESLTMQQPPGGGGAITCRTLGPIMAVAQLKSLSGRLDELGLEPRHRTSEKREAKGYWVYMSAMKHSDALEIKRKLDQHKDKEYYIGKDNFISLGTFRGKSRAEVRLRQVRKLGLEALLEPRFEIQTAHWLDIDRLTSDAIDLGAVMEDYPGIRLQEQVCY